MPELRNSLIAKIHIAKKDMGLDDELYRSIIKQAVNKDSAKACTDKQLVKVLEFMETKGWKNPSKQKFRKAPDGLKKKIYALWGVLQNAGAVQSRDKTALDAYAKKYTQVDCVQWLDNEQANKIIEMLKQWIARIENNAESKNK